MKIYASLLLFLCFIPSAHAYIDPGSGSFMIQMLIASLIGASFTVKAYFKVIKERIRLFFGKQIENPDMKNSQENKLNKDEI